MVACPTDAVLGLSVVRVPGWRWRVDSNAADKDDDDFQVITGKLVPGIWVSSHL
jgi:hypothetical protein